MTSPQPLTPIQELWLHTLVANREKLGDMKPHWSLVQFIEKSPPARLCDILIHDDMLVVTIKSPITILPRIEQQEIMQYVLARVHSQLCGRTNAVWPRGIQDFDGLCALLHCCPTHDSDTSVRWRKMQMLHYRHELPYANLEDRPICGICHGRVATGAGYVDDKPVQPGGYPFVRPDVHNECYRYAKLILVPALKAKRQLDAQKASAEVDK